MLQLLNAIGYNYVIPGLFILVGAMVYRFTSLLTWDLLRALTSRPVPEGQVQQMESPPQERKRRFKFLCCFFIFGAGAEVLAVWLAQVFSVSAGAYRLILTLGFSVPLF